MQPYLPFLNALLEVTDLACPDSGRKAEIEPKFTLLRLMGEVNNSTKSRDLEYQHRLIPSGNALRARQRPWP